MDNEFSSVCNWAGIQTNVKCKNWVVDFGRTTLTDLCHHVAQLVYNIFSLTMSRLLPLPFNN